MARRRLPPFETEITALGPRGVGVGRTPSGREVHVRGAPPGARVYVVPAGKRKGVLKGRREAMIRPPAEYEVPACPVFGLCGGCQLQELSLDAQRQAKHRAALDDIGLDADRVHAPRGTDAAYAYRNKVELSFGCRRYLSEADHAAGLPIEGRFLGFHAPGRFDRVVDALHCPLISERLNALLTVVRRHSLHEEAPVAWDPRQHTGFWRHLLLREGVRTDQQLVALFTATATPEQAAQVEALGEELARTATAVVWLENDEVADVARGKVRKVWGQDHIDEKLGELSFRLSVGSFFQTNTEAAEVLYDTVVDAVGEAGGRLYDLYSGTGSIALYLGDRFTDVVGIEEVPAAVEDAKANALRNGRDATWLCAKVEDALHALEPGRKTLIVDPPRAGLHPRVTRALCDAEAEVLVYVACRPGSLGRDGKMLVEAGWRLTDLWTVDLFPQTGHMEAVGRFERRV